MGRLNREGGLSKSLAQSRGGRGVNSEEGHNRAFTIYSVFEDQQDDIKHRSVAFMAYDLAFDGVTTSKLAENLKMLQI